MSVRGRTAEVVVLALVVLLAGGAALLGGDDSGSTEASRGAEQVSRERIALIQRRVERLRGLRFRRPVRVAIVSPAEARRVGLAEYDRSQPVARRRVNDELLKLLGLLPADTSMRRIAATIFAEQVAGYYDPRRDRLALVRGAGVDDVTLAHELVHALEDQHADLERLGDGRDDDAAQAEQALVEGTATLVMTRYEDRWPSAAPVGDALAGLTEFAGGTPLPPFILRSLVFPYLQGERFVEALWDASGGDWRLVDVALRARPPATTAEILEPVRWLRAERAVRVPVTAGDAVLPRADGWRRLAGSTLGAENVAALLSERGGDPFAARELTEGWRGGRYALWRRGPLDDPGCAAPCRKRDALLLAVRMETAGQAWPLARALRRWVVGLPAGVAFGVRVSGATVSIALAPSEPLAERLVSASG